jgi:hypothetical protein
VDSHDAADRRVAMTEDSASHAKAGRPFAGLL